MKNLFQNFQKNSKQNFTYIPSHPAIFTQVQINARPPLQYLRPVRNAELCNCPLSTTKPEILCYWTKGGLIQKYWASLSHYRPVGIVSTRSWSQSYFSYEKVL